MLALSSAPVTNWGVSPRAPSRLSLLPPWLSASDADPRAPAPSLPQHPTALALLRSTRHSCCSRSMPGLTELGSRCLILGSAWDEKGCAEAYLAHDVRPTLTEPLFLAKTKPWGFGGKINILNSIWKRRGCKDKLDLRHIVALSNL